MLFCQLNNPTPNHNRVEFCYLSIMAGGLRAYYLWNSIAGSVANHLCSCENLENFLPFIMSGPLHWCFSFLKFYTFVGHHKVLALFRFLRLVSKGLFHSLLNFLPVDVCLILDFFYWNIQNAPNPLYSHFVFSGNVDCSSFTHT